MEECHSETVELLVKQHKMEDITKVNDVCNFVAHVYNIVVGGVACYNSGWD